YFKIKVMNNTRIVLRSFMIFIGILFTCCVDKARTKTPGTITSLDGSLLTKNQVGARALADTIAPIKAPFYMPQLGKPVFNDVELSILETGARENYLSTKEIQLAIDKIHQQGGGRVIIPAGRWR